MTSKLSFNNARRRQNIHSSFSKFNKVSRIETSFEFILIGLMLRNLKKLDSFLFFSSMHPYSKKGDSSCFCHELYLPFP